MIGIEACLVKEYDGWDGDMDYMNFYNCILHPHVCQELGVSVDTLVDVDFSISEFFAKGSIQINSVDTPGEVIAKVTPVLNGLTIKFEIEVM